MNSRSDKRFEARLDQAIDQLNADRSPLVFEEDDPELISLVDTVRLVRSLREPSWPDETFPGQLARRLEVELSGPAHDNGHAQARTQASEGSAHLAAMPVAARPRRLRAALLAAAALLRVGAIGLLAGMIAGLLAGGIGGRLVMRISGAVFARANPLAVTVTESSGRRVGEFSVGGTLELMIFGGILFGLFGGLVYVAVRPWLPWSGWRRGLLFGVLLLATFGTAVIRSDNVDFVRLGPPALNLVLFGLLFVAFGLIVAPLVDYFERDMARTRSARPARARDVGRYLIIVLAWLMAAPILLGTLIGVLLGAGEGFGTLDRIDYGLFYVIVTAGVAARLLLTRATRSRASNGAAATAVKLALTLPVIVGLILTSWTIIRILAS